MFVDRQRDRWRLNKLWSENFTWVIKTSVVIQFLYYHLLDCIFIDLCIHKSTKCAFILFNNIFNLHIMFNCNCNKRFKTRIKFSLTLSKHLQCVVLPTTKSLFFVILWDLFQQSSFKIVFARLYYWKKLKKKYSLFVTNGICCRFFC